MKYIVILLIGFLSCLTSYANEKLALAIQTCRPEALELFHKEGVSAQGLLKSHTGHYGYALEILTSACEKFNNATENEKYPLLYKKLVAMGARPSDSSDAFRIPKSNDEKDVLLFKAIKSCDEGAILETLENGANPNARESSSGMTAFAIFAGTVCRDFFQDVTPETVVSKGLSRQIAFKTRIARELLKAGADLYAPNREIGRPAFWYHYLLDLGSHEAVAMFKLYRSLGYELTVKANNGQTLPGDFTSWGWGNWSLVLDIFGEDADAFNSYLYAGVSWEKNPIQAIKRLEALNIFYRPQEGPSYQILTESLFISATKKMSFETLKNLLGWFEKRYPEYYLQDTLTLNPQSDRMGIYSLLGTVCPLVLEDGNRLIYNFGEQNPDYSNKSSQDLHSLYNFFKSSVLPKVKIDFKHKDFDGNTILDHALHLCPNELVTDLVKRAHEKNIKIQFNKKLSKTLPRFVSSKWEAGVSRDAKILPFNNDPRNLILFLGSGGVLESEALELIKENKYQMYTIQSRRISEIISGKHFFPAHDPKEIGFDDQGKVSLELKLKENIARFKESFLRIDLNTIGKKMDLTLKNPSSLVTPGEYRGSYRGHTIYTNCTRLMITRVSKDEFRLKTFCSGLGWESTAYIRTFDSELKLGSIDLKGDYSIESYVNNKTLVIDPLAGNFSGSVSSLEARSADNEKLLDFAFTSSLPSEITANFIFKLDNDRREVQASLKESVLQGEGKDVFSLLYCLLYCTDDAKRWEIAQNIKDGSSLAPYIHFLLQSNRLGSKEKELAFQTFVQLLILDREQSNDAIKQISFALKPHELSSVESLLILNILGGVTDSDHFFASSENFSRLLNFSKIMNGQINKRDDLKDFEASLKKLLCGLGEKENEIRRLVEVSEAGAIIADLKKQCGSH